MADSAWPSIHAERRALAQDLADLTSAQWATQSLCADWTVHQVLAHQVATAKMTPRSFLTTFAGAGFSFTTFNNKQVAVQAAGGPTATLAAFRAVETATSSPPGPKDSWLGEALVHSEDIRRPLGLHRDYPLPAVIRAITFYAGSNAIIGGKKRVAGLTLRATDTDFVYGSGPEVSGPAMALLLATTGRTTALDDLTGPGLATLRAR